MSICTEGVGKAGGSGNTLLLTDIATKNVICLPPDGKVGEAARAMAELRISSIVVTDAGKPVGIVTERNILLVMHTGCPHSTQLRDVMSSPVISVPSSMPFLDAYQLCLRQGIRHLVIMDDEGAMVGMASETDFRMHMSLTALAGHRLVASVMTRSIFGMPAEANLEEALGMMRSHRDNCIVVIEKNLPVGIVTERDVVRLYSRGTDQSAALLRDVMTSPVLTVQVDESINEVARLMLRSRVRHLVVVDELGRLAGLISEHDLTQAMALGLMDDRMVAESSFLRTLINSIPDLVWLKNAEGVYLACNARFEQLMGAKEAEITGRTDYDFVDRNLADGFRNHDRVAMAAGKPHFSEEWLTFASDGYRGFFEIVKTPMHDSEGMLIGVLGVARDISRRRKLEKRLEESENKFRSIFESVNDCIEIISGDGQILDMNRAGYEMLGYAREDMVGRHLSRFAAPEYASRIPERMALITENGQARFESIRLGRDGRIVPLEVNSRTIELNGETAFLGIARDISERMRVDAELRASEEKWRLLFVNMTTGFALHEVICNEKGEVVDYRWLEANPAYERLTGLKADDIVGRTVLEILPGTESYWIESFGKVALTGETASYENFSRELGRWYSTWSFSPKRGQFAVIVSDITERKQAQAETESARQLLDSIIENVPNMIFLKSAQELRFELFNKAGEALLGIGREAMLGKNDYDIFPGEQADFFTAKDKAALEQGGIVDISEEPITTSQGLRILHTKKVPLYDGDGRPSHLIGISEDITERKLAEKALLESRANLAAAQRLAHVGSWEWNVVDNTAQWSEETYRIFGMELDALEGHRQNFINMIHPDDRTQTDKALSDALSGVRNYDIEYRIILPDAAIKNIHALAEVVRDADGKPLLMRGTVQDITERKQAERQIRESEDRYRRLVENSPDVIYVFSSKRGGIYYSRRVETLLGYSLDDLHAHPFLWSESIHPDDQVVMDKMLQDSRIGKLYSLEYRLRDAKGNWKWVRDRSMHASMEGDELLIEGLATDITLLKQHEQQLEHTAHYDVLTGIPNRVLLTDRMKQAIAQTLRERTMMAVCYLDLDGFKPINDTLGHEAGDKVLIEVARRIIGTIRGGDTVARLGGDEFVILLLGLEKVEECVASLERLLNTISLPIYIQDRFVTIGASIGVSIYPLEVEDADTLLRHADQAMYLAKQAGRHRFHIYDPSLDQRARSYNEFVKQIGHALESGQFELYYQPKIDLKTKALVGAEALIRWNHPEKGLMLPGEFLHVVENTELDARIGEWVIDAALDQLDRWRSAGMDFEVSINISAHHLESKGFARMIGEKLSGYPGLPPGALQIEVLETTALEDVEVVSAIMSACRALGVWFALDDFGTGYSSLFYLSRLPVDVLKIDQSFVRDMLEDRGDLAIVQGIIALARSFGRQTVAEGIETTAHYLTLVEMGCEIGQGYGIAPPMPAGELIRWKMV